MPVHIKRQHLLELSEVPCCLLKVIVLPWRAGEPELGGLSRAQNQKGRAACPNLGTCRVFGAALVGSPSQPCHGATSSSLSLYASPCQAPQGEMGTGWHSARCRQSDSAQKMGVPAVLPAPKLSAVVWGEAESRNLCQGEGAGDQQPSWCYGNSLSPGC